MKYIKSNNKNTSVSCNQLVGINGKNDVLCGVQQNFEISHVWYNQNFDIYLE